MTYLAVLGSLAGLIGACLVAFANYAVQRWRYKIDRLGLAVDQLCVELNSAAEMSSKYWLLDTTQSNDAKIAQNIEPELLGRQLRLQGLFLAIEASDKKIKLNISGQHLTLFYDDLTGGNFKVKNRLAEPSKAQASHYRSAVLNGTLRKALAKRSNRWL